MPGEAKNLICSTSQVRFCLILYDIEDMTLSLGTETTNRSKVMKLSCSASFFLDLNIIISSSLHVCGAIKRVIKMILRGREYRDAAELIPWSVQWLDTQLKQLGA